MKLISLLILAFSFSLQGALGELVCEELPVELCSFSVASSGNRCLLETYISKEGIKEYQCKTSQVIARKLHDYIENDECVHACGLDRKSVGISSDSLLKPRFIAMLCSLQCYHSCPNVIELYYDLALGEGAFLPDLCKAHITSSRRSMAQIQSSGVASGPVSVTAATPGAAVAPGPGSPVDCAPSPI